MSPRMLYHAEFKTLSLVTITLIESNWGYLGVGLTSCYLGCFGTAQSCSSLIWSAPYYTSMSTNAENMNPRKLPKTGTRFKAHGHHNELSLTFDLCDFKLNTSNDEEEIKMKLRFHFLLIVFMSPRIWVTWKEYHLDWKYAMIALQS